MYIHTYRLNKFNVWELLTTFPSRREKCAVEKIDNYIYVFGGYKPLGAIYNDYDAYDVVNNTWLSDNDRNDSKNNVNQKNVNDQLRDYHNNGNYYSSGSNNRSLFSVSQCKKSLSPYHLSGTIAAAVGI
jgi:hypothetical protein